MTVSKELEFKFQFKDIHNCWSLYQVLLGFKKLGILYKATCHSPLLRIEVTFIPCYLSQGCTEFQQAKLSGPCLVGCSFPLWYWKLITALADQDKEDRHSRNILLSQSINWSNLENYLPLFTHALFLQLKGRIGRGRVRKMLLPFPLAWFSASATKKCVLFEWDFKRQDIGKIQFKRKTRSLFGLPRQVAGKVIQGYSPMGDESWWAAELKDDSAEQWVI